MDPNAKSLASHITAKGNSQTGLASLEPKLMLLST